MIRHNTARFFELALFNPDSDMWEDARFVRWGAVIGISCIMFLVFGATFDTILNEGKMTAAGELVGLFVALFNLALIGFGRRILSPVAGIEDDYLREKTIEYLGLPNKDKIVPVGSLLSTLRGPMEYQSSRKLTFELSELMNEVRERNKARDYLDASARDLDGLVETLRESRESVGIETETFREYRDKELV